MPHPSAEEKERITALAVEAFAKGTTYTAIGEAYGITRQTARNWVQSHFAKGSEHRSVSDEREKAIAVYESVIRAGWQRWDRIKDSSNNVTGVLNSIISAQDSINDLTGAKAPLKFKDETEEPYEIVFDDDETH